MGGVMSMASTIGRRRSWEDKPLRRRTLRARAFAGRGRQLDFVLQESSRRAKRCGRRRKSRSSRPVVSVCRGAQGLQLLSGWLRFPLRVETEIFPGAAIADPAPIGERAGVQHVDFQTMPLFSKPGSDAKHFADISGDGVQDPPWRPRPKPVTCVGEASSSSVLTRVGIQPIDLAAIAGAEHGQPGRIESDGVHDVLRARTTLCAAPRPGSMR